MKKRILALLLICALGLLSACGSKADSGANAPLGSSGGSSAQPKPTAQREKVVFKLGHNLNIGHPMDQAANLFADLVNERTDGGIEVQVFSQVLGGEKDMTENLPMGTIDMIIVVGGNFAYLMPEFNFTSLAYLFEGHESAEKAYNSEVVGELYDRLIEEKNVRVLNPFFYYGARHITANKPIYGPKDLSGVKIRVPTMVPQQRSLEAMGGQATPVEFTELYMALQTGVVDAQENPFNVIIDNNYDQVQDYLVLSGHIIAQAFFAMNESKFQSLTPEQQQIILDAAVEAGELNNKLMVEQEDAGLQTLKDRGMEVIEPDLDAFRASVEGLHAEYDAKYDGLITKLKEAGK